MKFFLELVIDIQWSYNCCWVGRLYSVIIILQTAFTKKETIVLIMHLGLHVWNEISAVMFIMY